MKTQPTAKVLSEREFVLQHTFQAPAAKVFAAYTDPKLVAQWWAPKGGSMRVDRMDVRPGGSWRYVQRDPNGQETAFSGSYVEVKPVSRLVYTFETEGYPDSKVTAVVELKESGGKTYLTLTNTCVSKEKRDAMVQYGAAAGAKVAWDRLADLLGRA